MAHRLRNFFKSKSNVAEEQPSVSKVSAALDNMEKEIITSPQDTAIKPLHNLKHLSLRRNAVSGVGDAIEDKAVTKEAVDPNGNTKKVIFDTTEVNQPNEFISETIILEEGRTYDVYLSFADSMSPFYVKLLSLKHSTEQMMKAIQEHMTDANNKMPLVNAQRGDYCLAISSDELYGRAKIINICQFGYTVYFVDFGDHGMVPTVFDLNDEFRELPQQAIKCRLHDIQLSADNQEDALDILYRHSASSWSMEVSEIELDNDCHLVRITRPFDNGFIFINEEILKRCQQNKDLSAMISQPPKDLAGLKKLISTLTVDDDDDADGSCDVNTSESCFDIVDIGDILTAAIEHKEKVLEELKSLKPKKQQDLSYSTNTKGNRAETFEESKESSDPEIEEELYDLFD